MNRQKLAKDADQGKTHYVSYAVVGDKGAVCITFFSCPSVGIDREVSQLTVHHQEPQYSEHGPMPECEFTPEGKKCYPTCFGLPGAWDKVLKEEGEEAVYTKLEKRYAQEFGA